MPEGIHQFAIGNVAAWVLSDGVTAVDGGAIFGTTPRREWQLRTGPPDSDYCLELGLNCLLLRSDGRVILVDTGMGPPIDDDGETSEGETGRGKLLWTLAAMGIPPGDIDIVILTHMHPDHIGWATRRSDRGWVPVFNNAAYHVQRAEWDFWTHPQQLSENDFIRRLALPLEAAGRLKLVRGEHAVTDEVRLMPTPGHTPGHQSVVIRSGREAGIYAGDLAYHPSMLERLWTSGFDTHPLESKQTKRLVIEQALRESALIIGPHFRFPGVGRLVPDERGVRWVEENEENLAPVSDSRTVRRFRFLPQ
jgi:glyoxylase-like metal-dependent hydrolase (beta-lactamase superfamily II)